MTWDNFKFGFQVFFGFVVAYGIYDRHQTSAHVEEVRAETKALIEASKFFACPWIFDGEGNRILSPLLNKHDRSKYETDLK